MLQLSRSTPLASSSTGSARLELCLALAAFSGLGCETLPGWDTSQEDAAGRAAPSEALPAPSDDDVGFRVSIVNVRECRAPLGIELDPGERFIGVELEVEASSARAVPANYFYATVIDGKEREFAADAGGCEPLLGGPPLRGAASRRGFANFHLPKDAGDLKLRYQPRLEGVEGAGRALELPLKY